MMKNAHSRGRPKKAPALARYDVKRSDSDSDSDSDFDGTWDMMQNALTPMITR